MEKYLDKCLSSLLIPNIDDIEILVINDGSKDRSSEIAHNYADKYPDSIRVIDKENGNYGSCVNRGLKEATGKYVKILDADDYFDTTNFEKFVETLKEIDVDLVINDYSHVNESGSTIRYRTFDLVPNKRIGFDDVLNARNQFGMHALAYNTKIFRKFNYRQTEGISYTDREWKFIPMAYVESAYYFNQNLYNYLIGREGQTVSPQAYQKNIHNLLIVSESILTFYNQQNKKIDSCNKLYLYRELDEFFEITYKIQLINLYPDIPNLIIEEFDNLLRRLNPSLYDDMYGKKDKFGYKYIKYWRKHKKTSSLYLYIRKCLLKLKK